MNKYKLFTSKRFLKLLKKYKKSDPNTLKENPKDY